MKRIISTLVLGFTVSITGFAQSIPAAPGTPEKLSHRQLQTLIADAKTSAEHQRIATYYQAKAQDLLAQSRQHAAMAEQFKKNPVTASEKFTVGTVNHCEYIAQSLERNAAKLQQLAKTHEEMATASPR